jgi:hypothetical protein
VVRLRAAAPRSEGGRTGPNSDLTEGLFYRLSAPRRFHTTKTLNRHARLRIVAAQIAFESPISLAAIPRCNRPNGKPILAWS